MRFARGIEGDSHDDGVEGARFGLRSSSICSSCCVGGCVSVSRTVVGGGGGGGASDGCDGGSSLAEGCEIDSRQRLRTLRARNCNAICVSSACLAARARDLCVRFDGSGFVAAFVCSPATVSKPN